MFKLPSPLEKLDLSPFGVNQKVYIKRDDLIHPIVSGNKWRKLNYNFRFYYNNNYSGIISMGGAFSSHIQSLSFICSLKNIPCVILIRGQKPKKLNNILKQCEMNNAKLIYLSKKDYSNYMAVHDIRMKNWLNYYFIPEGGSNRLGIEGCQEIINEIDVEFDEIFCEVGTGTTLAGLASSCNKNKKVNGVVILKGAEKINDQIEKNYFNLFNHPLNKNINYLHQYHFGGYAKHNMQLINFIREFYKETGIKTDPIYSGKLFFALTDQLKKDDDGNKTVIALHSGGLSGIPGYENRYKLKLFS
jgi:1-aminocyclopropane-1-carboxylate deaminase